VPRSEAAEGIDTWGGCEIKHLKIRLAIASGNNCISGKPVNKSQQQCLLIFVYLRWTERQTDKQICNTSKRPHCLMHMAYCNIAVPIGISDITT